MKMYALRHREWLNQGSNDARVRTTYVRRARATRGIQSKLVEELEHATLYPRRAQAEQVKRYSEMILTVVPVEVIAKEIVEK